MDAFGLPSINPGRAAGSPNTSLENGSQPVAELGIFEGAMVGGRCLVINSKLGANIAVTAGAEFSPHGLQSHVAENSVTLVLDDTDAPDKGNHPRGGVCRFSIAPPRNINELMYGTFKCASVSHRFGPIRDDVRRGPNSNVHLPLPLAEDSVNVLSLGFEKPIAKKEHGRNAVVGPPTHS